MKGILEDEKNLDQSQETLHIELSPTQPDQVHHTDALPTKDLWDTFQEEQDSTIDLVEGLSQLLLTQNHDRSQPKSMSQVQPQSYRTHQEGMKPAETHTNYLQEAA